MRQIQRQQLQQKILPRQLQLMKLLQLPVSDLERAIKEEVEKNPLLEMTAAEEESLPPSAVQDSDWDNNADDEEEDYDYREHLEADPNETHYDPIMVDRPSGTDLLLQQLDLLPIDNRQHTVAAEIVGSLDDNGYLVRDLNLIANDLAFTQNIDISLDEAEQALRVVQSLEPAGVGARSLPECLQLQLQRLIDTAKDSRSPRADTEAEDLPSDRELTALLTAQEIVTHHLDAYALHQYAAICNALNIDESTLEQASDIIRQLNPKPASALAEADAAAYINPDIIVTQHDGKLLCYINDSHLPKLTLNSEYTEMIPTLEQQPGTKDDVQFLRSKQAAAEEFIDLIQQRHDTIKRVMDYIVQHQRDFLLTGDPDRLLPLRQREVADATGLNISTISRIANNKYLQTDFGTIALKECFTKGMATTEGDEVSIEAIKQRLADAVASEDKQEPLSDDALAALLNSQGYPLARRTVAKYRQQLGIPVARLRRIALCLLAMLYTTTFHAQQSYYDSLIAVRLEASAAKQASAAKVKTAKAAPPKTVATKPTAPAEVKPSTQAAPPATEATGIDCVSFWYDAFPRHRINPHGRTMPGVLPDEINLKLVADTSEFCFPVKNPKTSDYGWRWNRGHHGVDIRLRTGDPVRAAFGGTVRIASRMGGYGNCIVIRHPNGLETLYGHLSKISVKHGQEVAAGEVIGLGGSTGNSTGPHLHFECRFLYQTFDPEWILDFEAYALRTQRLHLDKSYFGIGRPSPGREVAYKADKSIIKESPKKRRSHSTTLNTKDF